MSIDTDSFPILIGVGQAVDRWDGKDVAAAPHPLAMIRTAIVRAIADTGGTGVAAAIDRSAFIRTFADSLRNPIIPFGTIDNLPHAVLKGTGLEPAQVVYSAIGGDQPQSMVNRLGAALAAGECEVAIIAGGEVTGALKAAVRNGHTLDWSDDTAGPVDDLETGQPLLSPYELRNGLGLPPQSYAAQEQAWRARHGLGVAQYRQRVGEVLARLQSILRRKTNTPSFRSPETPASWRRSPARITRSAIRC